jgi:hypothetical protein
MNNFSTKLLMHAGLTVLFVIMAVPAQALTRQIRTVIILVPPVVPQPVISNS